MFSLYTHAQKPHLQRQKIISAFSIHLLFSASLSNDCPGEIGILTFTDTQSVSEIHHAKKESASLYRSKNNYSQPLEN